MKLEPEGFMKYIFMRKQGNMKIFRLLNIQAPVPSGRIWDPSIIHSVNIYSWLGNKDTFLETSLSVI